MMTLKMAFGESTLFCTYKISDNWTDIVSIDIDSLSCTGCSFGIYICCPMKKNRMEFVDTGIWNGIQKNIH